MTARGEAQSDFTASVKLGSTEIARRSFKGLSKAPFSGSFPRVTLEKSGHRRERPLRKARRFPSPSAWPGKGTLYYAAELRYALSASGADARDEGIGIQTEILDEAGGIVPGTDLTLGRVYTMRLVFYSSKDRTFLALRAPLPSGAEAIDGSLLTSQIVKPATEQQGQDSAADAASADDFTENGYTTRIDDSEVRYFFDRLDRGRHEVSFLFRATTPGVYPTPPAQAELMYQPEVFGRTGGAVYRIVKEESQGGEVKQAARRQVHVISHTHLPFAPREIVETDLAERNPRPYTSGTALRFTRDGYQIRTFEILP